MSEVINTIIDKKAFEQLDRLVQGLEKANSAFLTVAESSAKLGKKSFKVNGVKEYNNQVRDSSKFISEANAANKEAERIMNGITTAKAKLRASITEENKQLVQNRFNTQQVNKANKEAAILSSRHATAMQKLTVQRNQAKRSIQDYEAKQALGIKTTQKEEREIIKLRKEYARLDGAYRKSNRTVGEYFDNVGNYQSGLKKFTGMIRGLVGAFGLIEGARIGLNFAKESVQLAQQAKSVEFAYKRLGDEGAKAFNDIKKSTRGLLSDLEIKKSLNEFDNFNISLEETDTLFEFLAVRAAQTGQSVDKLKDSLVEGLSKESKLRIDNLGISASQLNEELERTPDFVQAVANIAKKEIKKAGNILDDAANSQERWNADLENFKLLVGNNVMSTFSKALFDMGSSMIRAITPTQDLTKDIKKQQRELNFLVQKVTAVNVSEEERKRKIENLQAIYPNFLKNLDAEKVTNGELRDRLKEVNKGYIAKIALTELDAEILEKATEAGEKLNDSFEFEERAREKLAKTIGLTTMNRILETKTLKEATEQALKDAGVTREFELEALKMESKGVKMLSQKQKALIEIRNALRYSVENEQKSNEITKEANGLEEKKNRFLEKYKEILEDVNSLQGDSNELQSENNDLKTTSVDTTIEEKEALEGTVDAYSKAISELEAIRDATAQSTEEYQEQTKEIEKLKDALEELRNGIKEVAEEEGFEKINVQAIEDSIKARQDEIDKSTEQARQKQLFLEQTIADSFNRIGDMYGTDLTNFSELFTKKELRVEDYAEGVGEVLEAANNALFQGTIDGINAEISALDRKYAYILDNENLTADERERIQNEQEAKKKVLLTRQAKAEKQNAIFQTLINTGVAIVKTFANLGFPAGVPASIAVGALGALQVGLIASRKIPEFEKGKPSHNKYEGAAIVGEKRTEVIKSKDGTIRLTPSVPTLTHVDRDDIIFPSVNDFFKEHSFNPMIMNSLNLKEGGSYDINKMAKEFTKGAKEGLRGATFKNVNVNKSQDINHSLWKMQNINV